MATIAANLILPLIPPWGNRRIEMTIISAGTKLKTPNTTVDINICSELILFSIKPRVNRLNKIRDTRYTYISSIEKKELGGTYFLIIRGGRLLAVLRSSYS